jgi:hypothetical protein
VGTRLDGEFKIGDGKKQVGAGEPVNDEMPKFPGR